MKLTILGCHSATPKLNAPPTSQILEIKNHLFLIDCGEGTQVQLRKHKIKFSKIKNIFISHLHGDHVFGLVGLISTFRLLNTETKLKVFGPKGIKELIVTQLTLTESYAKYPVEFHELSSNESELIFEDDKVEVFTIPLKHRIYTNGFLFKEKTGKRNLNINAINKHREIEICDYNNLKAGKDFILTNGDRIPNSELTFDPDPISSYAFCSDTAYLPAICDIIKNCTLLYHESTFLEDNKELAQKTGHSTALEAGKIANQARAEQLILGHYSSRYKDLELFKQEAEQVFGNVALGFEGKTTNF